MNTRVMEEVASYYRTTLARHGPTPRGVDWNSQESQSLRFNQLLRICSDEPILEILDYGCGYGALADTLTEAGARFRYTGFDLAAEMIAAARTRPGGETRRFESLRQNVTPADYVLASGIFNVKLSTAADEWVAHVHETLEDMASLARKGFAFNALTIHSDPERQRDTLFYADPCRLFGYCQRRFSRRVALLHDYPLYEFTMLVRLED